MSNYTPLVTCIMPTADRRRFVPLAIEYFLRQDYPAKELLILDDGADSVADLIPEDERIRYIRLEARLTVGAKRNLACEEAQGTLIAHWDDDDWHAPHRLSYQVAGMTSGTDVCGIKTLLFYEPTSERAWKYVYPDTQKLWLSGSTLCYRRAFWQTNRFEEINVGEDARFVWSQRAKRMKVLDDFTFHVGMIHSSNVSPKQTCGAYWQPFPVEQVRQILGDDLAFYHPERAAVTPAFTRPAREGKASARRPEIEPVRNVYACLVHEKPECVVDLMRNLRCLDPSSQIILYNGGEDAELLKGRFPFERYGATLYPRPRPMRWGWLHDFALECMQHALEHLSFDTFTIVDSDQMGIRPGYSRHLAEALRESPRAGLFGNAPSVQPRHTRIPPAVQALKEIDLWRPFLRRFEGGEEKFVHWTFWPSTVFTHDAARDLVRLFKEDEELRRIMGRSEIWATEEVIFPTLVALLGYDLGRNPCSYDFVRYRIRYSVPQLEAAFTRPDVYWMHPVPRNYDDPLRRHIRRRFNHYEAAAPVRAAAPQVAAATEDEPRLLLTAPILEQMRKIEGWLDEAEADLLIAAASRALNTLPAPHAIVEVGSFCGRSTVVLGSVARALSPATKVFSVDAHDGRVGSLDEGVQNYPPTLETFRRNVEAAGLARQVEVIQQRSFEVRWERPISMLLVDGLHDYASVAADFYSFERFVVAHGLVAFHDYAPYYPGVETFVNELLRSGAYRKVHCEKSLILIEKLTEAAPFRLSEMSEREETTDARPALAAQRGGGNSSSNNLPAAQV